MENEEEHINSVHKFVDWFTKKYSVMCWVFLWPGLIYLFLAIHQIYTESSSAYISLPFSGWLLGTATALMLFVKIERERIQQEYKDRDRRLRESVKSNLNRL